VRRPRVFVPALCCCVFVEVHLRHGLIAPPAEASALVDGSRPAAGRRCATSASAALRLHRDWSGRRRRCRSLQSASSANPSRASRRCAKPPGHRIVAAKAVVCLAELRVTRHGVVDPWRMQLSDQRGWQPSLASKRTLAEVKLDPAGKACDGELPLRSPPRGAPRLAKPQPQRRRCRCD
jgi:hypothetical protein